MNDLTTTNQSLFRPGQAGKTLLIFLSVWMGICVRVPAQIATTSTAQQDTTGTFNIDGTDIAVSYTKLPADQPGVVTFTLPAARVKALKKGEQLTLTLPQQGNLIYEPSILHTGPGFSPTPIAFMLGVNKTVSTETLSFSCKAVAPSAAIHNASKVRIGLIME